MRLKRIVAIMILTAGLLTGCAKKAEPTTAVQPTVQPTEPPAAALDPAAVAEEAEMLAEPPQPAVPDLLRPEASGVRVKKNDKAELDYSNTQDGYLMVRYTAQNEKKLKAQVQRKGSDTTYTYNLSHGEWAVIPLTDGEGEYQVRVYENVKGTQYSLVMGESCTVALTDEFAPFVRPNQYVDYADADKTVALAAELTRGIEAPLEQVAAVYDYVINTLTYDTQKASSVKSGYVPDLDAVLGEKKGICFDYAALMTGMLRSRGIPCKMVFGYAGTVYHAWISVWTEETGWVDGMIFFDGTTWQRLDPTFAASALEDASILEFIGDGSNYTEKYLY